uniref:Uncharacterized protein n=1 Tax=Glycine max TaxID=3847 RepID=A0A0R0GUJ9_SOYBN
MDYGMRVVYNGYRAKATSLTWHLISVRIQKESPFFFLLPLSLSLSFCQPTSSPFSAMGCAGSSQSKPDGEPPLLFNPLKTSSLHSLFVKSLPISSWVAVKIPSFFFLFHGIREQACNFDSKKLY